MKVTSNVMIDREAITTGTAVMIMVSSSIMFIWMATMVMMVNTHVMGKVRRLVPASSPSRKEGFPSSRAIWMREAH